MAKRVPYLHEEQIERDAAALLAEYEQALGVTILRVVPIEDIVEKHLKLGIEFDDMHQLLRVPRSGLGLDPDILGTMFFDEAMTRRALDLLGSRRNDRYEAALAALREDARDRWTDRLARDPDELDEGEEAATPDEDGLRRFLEGTVMPWFDGRKKELANRPLIREQAFGEALDPDKLERLGRYEVHLDRKLERMLAMLLRLKDLRAGAVPG
ncbi:MAG: hypothetical protein FJX68_04225 [Alphaproteobacteria bacterium]|nr:hypothetical protein [Alphaproteobacteria bacterium]